MEELNLRNYAHLGDAIWELWVREVTTNLTQNPKCLHTLTTDRVNAKFQHEVLLKIQDILTPEEAEIIRRSRNLTIPTARKSIQSDYRMATAFEALIGWWYKNNIVRLEEMKKKLINYL